VTAQAAVGTTRPAPVAATGATAVRATQAGRRSAFHWALSGSSTAGREATSSDEAGGRLSCRFQARDLHLVLAPGSRGTTGRFTVLLDGRPPGVDHGVDVDDEGHGAITGPRLYQLVRRRGAVIESSVEIEFLDPGVEVCAFTFG
jgi:thioredoxin family protein